jgi:3-oxoacyl-[acyl-carrier protein] reductase
MALFQARGCLQFLEKQGLNWQELTMDLQLNRKRALVTGGTRGIGQAVALTLADEGCDIAICARNGADVAAAVEVLKAKGVNAIGASVDVTDESAMKAFVADSAEQLGGLDVMVSNVGAMAIGADRDAWQKNLQMDILGLVNMVEAGESLLQQAAEKNGDAAIIAIGSTASVAALGASSYGPVKAALVHYVKGLAKQFAGRNIRANVVSPGMVYFPGGVWNRVEQNKPEVYKAQLARNPMGRMGRPQDMANAVAFLASPRSAFTTGINMIVDGALTDRVNF